MDSLLDLVTEPEQIRGLTDDQLRQLASEVRQLIIDTVASNGGHLASNLGAVELTLALLAEFDFRRDKIVFDVGHQTYAWKILTGRRDQFKSLRKLGGLAGFPKRSESPYDFFDTGHSSTSISAALGMSRAMDNLNLAGKVLAVIGDGALTGGMAFEALNDAGMSAASLIVILNDNQMSISKNVGGLANHLENLRISPRYLHIKSSVEVFLNRLPLLGKPLSHLLHQLKRLDRMWLRRSGVVFEQFGFRYYGPIDGHDLASLRKHLRVAQKVTGPVLLHVITQKGKGYSFAERAPDIYHGVAPFVVENGVCPVGATGCATYSDVFGQHLAELASHQPRICAISAAMTTGTGLSQFAEMLPARFFDVGIAEQHALTLAAGLAAGGMRPVVALYSTFLQRAYDQLLHDVCLQHLPVVVAIDRAGIVGEDGETHQGIYDLSLLLTLPGIEVYCPPTAPWLRLCLDQALQVAGPVAIRYPRGRVIAESLVPVPVQSAVRPQSMVSHLLPAWQQLQVLRTGPACTIAALGHEIEAALAAADQLASEQVDCDVLAIVCAKPFDYETLLDSVRKTGRLVVAEEGVVYGSLGQAILPAVLTDSPATAFTLLSIQDHPLQHGSRSQLLTAEKLDAASIAAAVRQLLPDKRTTSQNQA